MKALDLLELELRRLPYIDFVGFIDRSDVLVVEVLASAEGDADTLRHQAERTCRAHLDRPFAVEVSGSDRKARIRLLHVGVEDGEVEVHLGFDELRTVGRAPGHDPTAAASATFAALQQLGAFVPFGVEAAALFEHPVGEGVMLVLGSTQAGPRYGVAAGPDAAEAAARATLHALNRYLATQSMRATSA